jgi:integrase
MTGRAVAIRRGHARPVAAPRSPAAVKMRRHRERAARGEAVYHVRIGADCINRRVDGGLELPLKVVQARLGHASIQMTADTYGHLFPRGDDGSELAAAEKALMR